MTVICLAQLIDEKKWVHHFGSKYSMNQMIILVTIILKYQYYAMVIMLSC